MLCCRDQLGLLGIANLGPCDRDFQLRSLGAVVALAGASPLQLEASR